MNEKGFTLIELLVLISIIFVLAAIAIPQWSDYRSYGLYHKELVAQGKTSFSLSGWKKSGKGIMFKRLSHKERTLAFRNLKDNKIEIGIKSSPAKKKKSKPKVKNAGKKENPPENKERITWKSNTHGDW